MKLSILMTVFNRELEVLLATLRSLRRAWPEDAELIVIDDGSTVDYSGIAEGMERALPCIWRKLAPYEAYRIAGYNNPARAFNEALASASGEKIVILSSDVIVTPRAMQAAVAYDLSTGMWHPRCLDLDSGKEYCGPTRIFPAPWMLVCGRDDLETIGGWDEAYLKGMCYEDNDLIGRLALQRKMFTCDFSVTVYHQSHDQPAYNVTDGEVAQANERNRRYTMEKWGGIPFDGAHAAFDVSRLPHPSGRMVFAAKGGDGQLLKAVAETEGMFAGAQ